MKTPGLSSQHSAVELTKNVYKTRSPHIHFPFAYYKFQNEPRITNLLGMSSTAVHEQR